MECAFNLAENLDFFSSFKPGTSYYTKNKILIAQVLLEWRRESSFSRNVAARLGLESPNYHSRSQNAPKFREAKCVCERV